MPRTYWRAPIARVASRPDTTRTCSCSTCRTGVTSRTTSPATSASTRSSPGGARYRNAMPSRKQRRRREKLKRHEWEYVQLDEEGNEVPVTPAEPKKAERNGKPVTTRARRPVREVKPPSWQRSAKRALIFVPFLFVFLSLGSNAPALPTRVGISVLYAVVFIPMFFFVDRIAYRAYQRRVGQS